MKIIKIITIYFVVIILSFQSLLLAAPVNATSDSEYNIKILTPSEGQKITGEITIWVETSFPDTDVAPGLKISINNKEYLKHAHTMNKSPFSRNHYFYNWDTTQLSDGRYAITVQSETQQNVADSTYVFVLNDHSMEKIFPSGISVNKVVEDQKSVSVGSGDVLDVCVTVENVGDTSFSGLSVVDVLPWFVEYDGSVSYDGVYNEVNHTVQWSIGEELSPGDTITVTYDAVVSASNMSSFDAIFDLSATMVMYGAQMQNNVNVIGVNQLQSFGSWLKNIGGSLIDEYSKYEYIVDVGQRLQSIGRQVKENVSSGELSDDVVRNLGVLGEQIEGAAVDLRDEWFNVVMEYMQSQSTVYVSPGNNVVVNDSVSVAYERPSALDVRCLFSMVPENQSFVAYVTDEWGIPFSGATVEFADDSSVVDESGVVSFVAPVVDENTSYEISAYKNDLSASYMIEVIDGGIVDDEMHSFVVDAPDSVQEEGSFTVSVTLDGEPVSAYVCFNETWFNASDGSVVVSAPEVDVDTVYNVTAYTQQGVFSNSTSIVVEDTGSVTTDLSVDKVVNDQKSVSVGSGDVLDVCVTVENVGDTTFSGLVISDVLPSFLTYKGDNYCNRAPDEINESQAAATNLQWYINKSFKPQETIDITYHAVVSPPNISDLSNSLNLSSAVKLHAAQMTNNLMVRNLQYWYTFGKQLTTIGDSFVNYSNNNIVTIGKKLQSIGKKIMNNISSSSNPPSNSTITDLKILGEQLKLAADDLQNIISTFIMRKINGESTVYVSPSSDIVTNDSVTISIKKEPQLNIHCLQILPEGESFVVYLENESHDPVYDASIEFGGDDQESTDNNGIATFTVPLVDQNQTCKLYAHKDNISATQTIQIIDTQKSRSSSLIIKAPPEVKETAEFTVTITYKGVPLSASVSFNETTQSTKPDGTITLTAPQVNQTKTYNISAHATLQNTTIFNKTSIIIKNTENKTGGYPMNITIAAVIVAVLVAALIITLLLLKKPKFKSPIKSFKKINASQTPTFEEQKTEPQFEIQDGLSSKKVKTFDTDDITTKTETKTDTKQPASTEPYFDKMIDTLITKNKKKKSQDNN